MDIDVDDFVKDTKLNLTKIILDNTHPIYYGSIANNDLAWRGDIDLMTILETKDRNKILKELKSIIKKHKSTDNGLIFTGEVKFGEDEPVKEKIEEMTKSMKFDKNKLKEYIKTLKKPDNYDTIVKLIDGKISNDTFYELKDELREFYTYRWSGEDIVSGKADKVLEQNSPVFKIDFQIWNGVRYIETSNFIIFKSLKKEKISKKEEKEEFVESLRDNIFRIFNSDKNYYKTLKRLLTYYRQVGNAKLENEMTDFVNDPEMGNLYLFLTLLKVHKTIIKEHKSQLNDALMKKSLDSLKNNTIYFNNDMRDELNNWIDKTNKKKSSESLKDLEDMIENCQEVLNKITLKEAKRRKINILKLIKGLN